MKKEYSVLLIQLDRNSREPNNLSLSNELSYDGVMRSPEP